MYQISNESVSDVDIEADLAWNRKSSTILYRLFYGNIRCTRIFGTLWCMHRPYVPGPLSGPGTRLSKHL